MTIPALNRYWRIAATGFCFAVFGLGGMIIALLMIPVALIMPASRAEGFGKGLIRLAFKSFIFLMKNLGVLTYSIDGVEKLHQPGQVIIANHPTLIDVIFLVALTPRADCVVKGKLLRNPFTFGPITASNYIVNDDPEKALAAAQASLARGNSLIIFPEGTRTTPGKPMVLQRGAANIALRTANTLRPVIIQCTPLTLTKQSKWYQVPERRFHIHFQVCDAFDLTPFQSGTPTVMSRKLTTAINDYFTREITTDE